MSQNATNHRVERRAWRVLGDAMVSTPAGRDCHDAGVEFHSHSQGCNDTVVIGRARIAHLLGRSERTISRWIRRGILPASKAGPHKNNLLKVRVADLDRLAHS